MSDNELSDVESIISEEEEQEIIPTKKKNFALKQSFKEQGEDDEDDDEDDEDDQEEQDDEDIELSDDEINNDSENEEINNNSSLPFIQEENLNPTLVIPDQYDSDSDINSNDDDDDDDTNYLEKFDSELRDNYILQHHPEDNLHNVDEINALSKVKRNDNNDIVDELHRTIPLLSKYEKARILGIRAKQLNNGSKPYIKLDKPIIDGMLIAIKELQEKKLPFIIRRPIPNGSFEYWPLSELEVI